MAQATRSYLYFSANRADFSAAVASGADALVLDLGDAAGAARAAARDAALALLKEGWGAARLLALVAPLGSADIDADLASLVPAGVDGVLLPRARGGASVQHLSAKLAVQEAECGRPDGATRIVALAAQTPAAFFALGDYAGASPRLEALAFDAAPLRRALGEPDLPPQPSGLSLPLAMARAALLLGAAAAGVTAVDGPFPPIADEPGLRMECLAALREGFRAKLAVSPAQIGVIDEIFGPNGPGR